MNKPGSVNRDGFEECWTPMPAESPKPFTDKISDFDQHATAAVAHLIAWLGHESDVLTAMARGRLAEGHYRYGDKYLFELSPEELDANAAQELADAIVYVARRFTLGTK